MNKRSYISVIAVSVVIIITSILWIGFNSSKDSVIDKPKNQEGDSNPVNNFSNKINININGDVYTATLEDNKTTREFVKKLPLVIKMDDMNQNEKYYYLNDSLPTDSKRIGSISSGDIMLYGSDCLVIFYESFNSSYSYTKIGEFDKKNPFKNNYGNKSVSVEITQ